MIKTEVKAGDTDSIHLMIKVPTLDKAVSVGTKITEGLNKHFDEFVKQYNVDNHIFSVKMEGVAETAFYKAKKRYAMKLVWQDGKKLIKPEYKIVGLEPKRSDNPEITEKTVTKVIKMILNKKPKALILQYVSKQINSVLNNELPLFNIAIPKGLQKPLRTYFQGVCRKGGNNNGCGYIVEGKLPFSEPDEYANKPLICPKCGKKLSYGRPVHPYAADWSNANLGTKFKEGMKIRYVYVRYTSPETHVVGIDEDTVLPKTVIIDRKLQAEKVITDKVLPLIKILKTNNDNKTKQLTLG